MKDVREVAECIEEVIKEYKFSLYQPRQDQQYGFKGFLHVRNTKGFVLYFIMRKYTSVPYIGGISVWHKCAVQVKCSTSISVLYK